MSTPDGGGLVVYRMTGGIDAIDEYSRRLVGALGAGGTEAGYSPNGLTSVLAAGLEPSWVLLQYNPFRYGRSGFAPRLLRDARRMRRRLRTRLAVMVHEAWVDMTDWRSGLIGVWQRAQLRDLLHLADGVMTSTQALAREIGGSAVHLPVATNITPVPTSPSAARDRLGFDGRLTVALFGRGHPSRALDHAEAAIAALAVAHGPDRLVVVNLGADAPRLRVPPEVEVTSPGHISPDEVSLRLWASDIVLLPFTDGVSTRRTTMMAALAHGRPVLGLNGPNTDAVLAEAPDAMALTPVGDLAAFARAAVELAGDPRRLSAIGEAGRRLYESRFDWPVLARRVASLLETMTASPTTARSGARGGVGSPPPAAASRFGSTAAGGSGRRAELVFVAHNVDGSGGMERVSERLLDGLLEAGHSVTVVARTCSLGERTGLRFVRVRTPARPFALAYPAFFAVASALVARRGDALVHTTGAIVGNRADVSTVHYCHRAALARLAGSRASRPSPLYRINATVSLALSLAAEAWCYRPGRTRLLCAVSGGVAAELRERFPAMNGGVRTVPNGVNSEVFHPDPAVRLEVRAELGVDESAALALFVGGDWERKGLAHAVDALAFAPDWQLAVAGAGDPKPLIARAKAVGTDARLRFLGTVGDVRRLYNAGDAFVLPTAYEAFPLVTLEAAASGLPLLVTRVNGVEDLLQDGSNGWFIARDGRDIARRLNELSSEPDPARDMAEAARAAATEYSWEAMTDGYLSLYGEIADGLDAVRTATISERAVDGR